MTDGDESSDNSTDEESPSTKLNGKTTAEARIRQASSGNSQSEEDEEREEGWGASKKDYYNADVIETEADALEEEAEAIRVQKKQLQGMTEADYGFDEAEWLDSGKVVEGDDDSDREGVIREYLPQLVITDTMGVEERTKLLSARYPEFEPLAKEFLQLQSLHKEFTSSAQQTSQLLLHPVLEGGDRESKVRHITAIPVKRSALSAYLAALSMYFALFTSNVDETGISVPMASSELRAHPHMDTLVQCRKLWEKVKDLEIPESNRQHIVTTSDDPLLSATLETTVDIVSAIGHANQDTNHPKKHKRSRNSKAQRAAEAALAEANTRRAERLQRTEEDLARLTSLVEKTSKSSLPIDSQTANGEDGSDFGEEMYLTAHEAEEKAKRKKSLRFYTSQIAQKVNKRHNAGRAAGGDDDLPYRERFRDRQARLTTEAEAKGKKRPKDAGVALGGDSGDEDKQVAKQVRDGTADEEYYDIISVRSQKKKAEKAALAAAQQQAVKEGGIVHAVEEVGPDGKRGITYAIEKNKGLTPKRKKEVRNSRVKKRKKYEESKKKLASIRQVYKGGEGRGGYGGELTGIKKGLVRSVKL